MKRIYFLITLLLYIYSFTYSQQKSEYKNNPDYYNFDKLDSYNKLGKKAEIALSRPLLELASKMDTSEDNQLSELLKNLFFIRIDVFPVTDKNIGKFQSIISKISDELQSKKWSQLAYVKEKKEIFEIYARLKKDKLSGIVVMVLGPKEAVFSNIVGEIDLNQIGKLGSNFNIPKLDELSNIKKNVK